MYVRRYLILKFLVVLNAMAIKIMVYHLVGLNESHKIITLRIFNPYAYIYPQTTK